MSLVPCPGCSLPRTANDAEFECPVCGFVPGAEAEAVAVAAAVEPVLLVAAARRPVVAPAVSREPSFLPWVLAGVGFGGTMVCAAGWYLASTDLPRLPDSATAPARELAAREVAPPHAYVEPPATQPTPPTSAEPKNPWRVDAVKPAPPVVKKVEPAVNDAPFEVIRVDAPVEDFRLDPVDGKRRVKLVGVANKFYLASVTGGAVVDASELDTKWVNVTGRIDEGATVKIAAPGGLVNFTEGVGGGATVVVAAAGGTVTFAKRGTPKVKVAVQPNIAGGARVTITGRQVTFLSPVVGDGTVVDVTLSPRGHLRFTELDGGAKLLYRQSKPTDPPLIVNPGTVRGDAEFKRAE